MKTAPNNGLGLARSGFPKLFIVIASACLMSSMAFAQSIDTLEKIRKTRVLAVGIRDNNLPFTTLSQGMATGYSVELCNKVLEQTRKDLKLPDIRIQYVPVTAANRISKLKDGSIDIECGQTVNTKSRQAEASFSYAHFVAGERFISRKESGFQSHENLAGKTVGVVKGTTAEKLFAQLKSGPLSTMNLVLFNDNQEAMKALEAGGIAAFGQVDIALESLRMQSSTPERFAISAKAMSIEPMALMFRKDDAALRAIADKTLAGLYSSGEIMGIYDRWFNSGMLQVGMSQMLRECLKRPSRDAAVALDMGYSL